MNAFGALRRIAHLVLYYGYVKRRISRTDSVTISGLRLTIPPTVFHPGFYSTSRFFASLLQQRDASGKKGLEIGCGSGILSLVAARNGAMMVAVDSNPAAVAATLGNARDNSLESRIVPIKSDLFGGLSPLHRDFDFIICNPPYYARKARNESEKAWNGGENQEFLRRLSLEARRYLKPGGALLVILSSDVDVGGITAMFRDAGFRFEVIGTRRLFFERLFIFEAKAS